APAAAVIDHCQRQKAPGLLGVLRRLRQAPQLSPIKVLSKPNRRGHGKPPLFATVNHKSLRRETVDRESYSHAAGIIVVPEPKRQPSPLLQAGKSSSFEAL